MANTLSNTQGRVREWVGPRIIPVFADEVQWSSETNYEPLMMVQNQGETFMSRQYVPAGAPLPNTQSGEESTDYWVHMSNWNAQVEGYREEVMRYAQEVLLFDGRIDSLEDALPISEFDSTNTVDAAINAINTAISNLGDLLPASSFTSSSTVEDAIEAVADSVDDVKDLLPATAFTTSNTVETQIYSRKRNYILIGDSFGVGVTPDVPLANSKGWIQWCEQFIGNSANVFWGQVPLGGVYGFASSRPFLEVLQDIEENYVDIDKRLITDIVVLAGTNDVAYASLVETKISQFAAYCHTHFPNAVVRIGVIGTNIRNLRHYIAPVYATCTKYGCGYIDCLNNLMCDPTYIASDNVHLTQAGYEYYSPWVCDTIVNGSTKYIFEKNQVPFTVDNSSSFYTPGTFETVKVAQIVTESYASCQLRTVGGLFANNAAFGYLNTTATTVNIPIGHTTGGLSMPVYSAHCQKGELLKKVQVAAVDLSRNVDVFSTERKAYIYIADDSTHLSTKLSAVVAGAQNSTNAGEATNFLAIYDRSIIPNQASV